MAIKLHATANEIELKKNRIKSLNEVTDHDEGYPTALAAKQYTDKTEKKLSRKIDSEIVPILAQKLDKTAGGTVSGNVEFTGDVIVQNAPTVPKSAVNKEYADSLAVTVDAEMSETSENPVQNKVLYEAFSNIQTDLDNSFFALKAQINKNHPYKTGTRLFYTKTTEEVKAVTMSSKGEPWALREFYLGIYIPATPELNSLDYIKTSILPQGSSNRLFFTGRTVITGITGGTPNTYHRYIVFAHTGNGFWRFNAGISLNIKKPSSSIALNCIPDGMGIVTKNHSNEEQIRAKEITISTTSSTATFPIGTEIEVYGI